jgi:hypothetical protein
MSDKIKLTRLETFFSMQSGKACYHDFDKFKELLRSLPDGYYIHKIEPVGRKRTIKQNNSMWGIPYLYFKRALVNSGNYKDISDDQVHQFCMHHCLPSDYKERILKEYQNDPGMVDMTTGEIFKSAFRLTTTKMTTIDAMHYYENMQAFYSEWLSSGREDDIIPDPDPKYKEKSNNQLINQLS